MSKANVLRLLMEVMKESKARQHDDETPFEALERTLDRMLEYESLVEAQLD